jgi:phosphocarrier protein
MIKKEYILKIEKGLHARPCAAIVGGLQKFNLESAYIFWKGQKVNMLSIMGTLSLALTYLATFNVEVSGADEKKAIEFLDVLFNTVDL